MPCVRGFAEGNLMSLKIYTLSERRKRPRRRMSPRPPLRKRLPFNSTYGAGIDQTAPAEHVRNTAARTPGRPAPEVRRIRRAASLCGDRRDPPFFPSPPAPLGFSPRTARQRRCARRAGALRALFLIPSSLGGAPVWQKESQVKGKRRCALPLCGPGLRSLFFCCSFHKSFGKGVARCNQTFGPNERQWWN